MHQSLYNMYMFWLARSHQPIKSAAVEKPPKRNCEQLWRWEPNGNPYGSQKPHLAYITITRADCKAHMPFIWQQRLQAATMYTRCRIYGINGDTLPSLWQQRLHDFIVISAYIDSQSKGQIHYAKIGWTRVRKHTLQLAFASCHNPQQ